ncbi:MAG: hypothetical protein P9L92_13430 [Candidatus Electryonea clarkiae]|nr:hypothetical protein [Candidatus Electryonea clarkiae]MDP8288903.1 hypothetical protein [Candidatus Electryonea clarkiae]
MKKLIALSLADAKNISRDSTLILVLFGTVALFLMLWLVVPLVTGLLIEKLDFDLTEYYPLIVSFMALIPSMLFGMIIGFIILDERDEEIISYIAVTPLMKSGYFTYKLLVSTIISFLYFFVILYLTGLTTLGFIYAVPLAFMVALEAPMLSLFFAAFAENKVEGMALGKAAGIMYLGPFVAYFFKSDWQYLAGIMPPFWVTKAFLSAQSEDPAYWLFVFIGISVHFVFISLLLKRFLDSQR